MPKTNLDSSAVEASFDEDNDLRPVDEQMARRAARRFRIVLDGGSLALFGIFLIQLVPLFLSADLQNSSWQGQFVERMVDLGLIPFLAFLMLHLAVFVQSGSDRLRRRLRFVRSVAVVPVLGYLLLIPLQISSSVGELTTARQQKVEYQEQVARLSEIREAVQQSKSVQDLNVRLQSLLQPALTSDQLNQSLPELRKTLISDNESKQEDLSRKLMKNSQNFNSFALAISRVGASLGWAFAFASGAVPWGSRSTLLERIRRRA